MFYEDKFIMTEVWLSNHTSTEQVKYTLGICTDNNAVNNKSQADQETLISCG